jgi:group II intron reverse transcriptase/maturase
LRVHGARGGNHVLDADIRDYFGSIDQSKLLMLVALRISDRRVLKLLRQWLTAGVIDEGQRRETLSGTPQGGVISPLLSNIYLHVLDRVWETKCAHLGTLVRYADDFVVMCDTKTQLEEARRRVEHVLTRLGLELHPEKTRLVDLSREREGFDFLGCHLRKRMSGPIWERARQRVYYLQRWPSQRAMRRVRQRVRDLTPRRRCHEDLRLLIADLNPVLRGWGQYFRTGNAADHFTDLDAYVVRRLRGLRLKRANGRPAAGQILQWDRPFFETLGLCRLRGTIRYPGAA